MALVAVVAVVAVLIFGPACVWGQQLFSSELHQHLPEAASEATTLPLLELACRHPIQVSLLCLKGQFVSLSFLQKLPAKMTWASNIQRHNAIK